MIERGGAGTSFFSKRLRRDGGLRTRLRTHRHAVGSRIDRVQRWVIGDRAGELGEQPSAQSPTASRSTESGPTAPFPPYEEPVNSPAPQNEGSSSHVPLSRPTRRSSLTVEEVKDPDPSRDCPTAPTRSSSIAPNLGDGCSKPTIQEVHFTPIKWARGHIDDRNNTSNSSEISFFNSLTSGELRSIRRRWLRDVWELRPTDFRLGDVDLSRPRSFDTSWLASVQGRTWMEAVQAEMIFEAELVSDSAENSSSSSIDEIAIGDKPCTGGSEQSNADSRTGNSAGRRINPHIGYCESTSTPSSYKLSDYTTRKIQKLAFRVRPASNLQGTRTLSLTSWFDKTPCRRIGSWLSPRPPAGESNESQLRPAIIRLPSDDIYNATPLQQQSPERAGTPNPLDQPAISSVPAEVNNVDNEVLESIKQLFKPSVETILDPPRTPGLNLPEWDFPRRRSTIDSSDPLFSSTAASSRFPSIGSEITPATTAGEASRTEGSHENEDTPRESSLSGSKVGPSTEDTHGTEDATPVKDDTQRRMPPG